MIARRITYHGDMSTKTAQTIFNITRKIEINGEVKHTSPGQVELILEGDPSMIVLTQHQIEKSLKGQITKKDIIAIGFGSYRTLTFLS